MLTKDIFTGLIGLALIAASCYIVHLNGEFWPQALGLLWLAGKIYQKNETAGKVAGIFK